MCKSLFPSEEFAVTVGAIPSIEACLHSHSFIWGCLCLFICAWIEDKVLRVQLGSLAKDPWLDCQDQQVPLIPDFVLCLTLLGANCH